MRAVRYADENYSESDARSLRIDSRTRGKEPNHHAKLHSLPKGSIDRARHRIVTRSLFEMRVKDEGGDFQVAFPANVWPSLNGSNAGMQHGV